MATKKRPTRRDRATAQEKTTAEQLVKMLQEMPDVRQDLVDRVRREIAEGTYETPERVEKAIQGMMRDLFENGQEGGEFLT